jgi:hypothetical protein
MERIEDEQKRRIKNRSIVARQAQNTEKKNQEQINCSKASSKHRRTLSSHQAEGALSSLHSGTCKELTCKSSRI